MTITQAARIGRRDLRLEGFEHSQDSSGKPGVRPGGNAKSDAFPPDLARVVNAWPELPEAVRAAVLALVRAAD